MDPEARLADRIASLRTVLHVRSSRAPLAGPDADGAFPDRSGFDILGLQSRLPPVVIDTNQLCRDVGYSCRNSRRTTLVNVANSGALRVLCPHHVADEIVEHAGRFSSMASVSPERFLEVWAENYLPVLRMVDEVLPEALTDVEQQRVDRLSQEDPDDVPTARLAIATQALILSEDGALVDAVRGAGTDLAEQRRWVGQLKAGGDASELASILDAGAVLFRLVGVGGASALKSPTGAVLVGSLGMTIVRRFLTASPAERARLRRGLSNAAGVVIEIVDAYESAVSSLRGLAAPAPSPGEFQTMDPTSRLLRACLTSMGVASSSTQSARSLRSLLPPLVVPSGEAKVRAVLRSYACFAEVSPGRFQLGRAFSAAFEASGATLEGRSGT